MRHGGNIIAELTSDHRALADLFQRVQAEPSCTNERRAAADQAIMELVGHLVAEEQYFYPAMREHVFAGGLLANRGLTEHAQIEQMLKDLEGHAVTDRAFDELRARLMTEVTEHAADEESRLFPLLIDACTTGVLDELGEKVRRSKALGPTRPHPAAPDVPPANRVVAPGVGLFDRARDRLSGRGVL
jgi:iron-sulfur cluster repair protein YtfE (RIC family)